MSKFSFAHVGLTQETPCRKKRPITWAKETYDMSKRNLLPKGRLAERRAAIHRHTSVLESLSRRFHPRRKGCGPEIMDCCASVLQVSFAHLYWCNRSLLDVIGLFSCVYLTGLSSLGASSSFSNTGNHGVLCISIAGLFCSCHRSLLLMSQVSFAQRRRYVYSYHATVITCNTSLLLI